MIVHEGGPIFVIAYTWRGDAVRLILTQHAASGSTTEKYDEENPIFATRQHGSPCAGKRRERCFIMIRAATALSIISGGR
jgi:hypothetical protein